MEYLLLAGGLILLIISGNYLVKSAVNIARKFKLSSLIIGMTIVAFGTSAPELMVSAQAAIGGHSEIALGNVVGSNIVNIGLILGLTVLILPVKAGRQSIKFDWTFLACISLLMVIFAWEGTFGRIEGIVAFAVLVAFTVYSIKKSKKNSGEKNEEYKAPAKPTWLSVLVFLIACVGLAYGADFMVEGASTIATNFGISERVISIVIVGAGTSLPEFTASLIAAFKKEEDMSLGNIIGSNIFNILAVLGISSIIQPIHYTDMGFHSDFLWMLGFTLLLFFGMLNITENYKKFKETRKLRSLLSSKDGLVGRIWGVMAVVMYVVYVVLQFV